MVEINMAELKACLGLLFLGGLLEFSHTSLKDVWKT